MFNDFENFIVIKGNDKEEYRLTGSLRKVALEPDI